MSSVTDQSRRQFVKTVATGTAIAGSGFGLAGCSDDDEPVIVDFMHGVASGDPLSDRVIIWTRVTTGDETSVSIDWQMASDEAFSEIVAEGSAEAALSSDHTVKIDVTGLLADSIYYYRFLVGSTVSPVGRTRTLPEGDVDEVRLAVFSCSNYPAGFFHVYAEAALAEDVNAVLHLGDYIYEYGKGGYASADAEALGRESDPENELLSLEDYRLRYSQYRTDEDLQALHARFPFIIVWDDHEFANDAWREGAENHNDGEGEFLTRQANALKAWQEWLPVRLPDTSNALRIYRRFEFGNLLSLHMLDTRVVGRDQQLDYANYVTADGIDAVTFEADLTDSNRQLLGAEQTAWLSDGLAGSAATWQVLGQQVLMGRMNIPAPVALQQISFADYAALAAQAQIDPTTLTDEQQAILAQPSIPYNLDAWDGYFAAREAVLAAANEAGSNLVVLSGDTHNAWASNLQDMMGNSIGVEFATPSVSSPGLEEILSEEPAALAGGLVALIDTLQYADTALRGYLLVTFTTSSATGEWRLVDSVKEESYSLAQGSGMSLTVLENAREFSQS